MPAHIYYHYWQYHFHYNCHSCSLHHFLLLFSWMLYILSFCWCALLQADSISFLSVLGDPSRVALSEGKFPCIYCFFPPSLSSLLLRVNDTGCTLLSPKRQIVVCEYGLPAIQIKFDKNDLLIWVLWDSLFTSIISQSIQLYWLKPIFTNHNLSRRA